MECKEVDVLIVGGGPAGSMTAMETSKSGLSTLQIEQNPEFGFIQRCGEGVLQKQLQLYFPPNPEFIRTTIHKARFYAPNGIWAEMNKPNGGYILDRQKFDIFIAKKAKQNGTIQWLNSYPVKIDRQKENKVVTVIVKNNKQYKITSKIIVGADGVASRVGKWMGVNAYSHINSLGCGCQEIIESKNIDSKRIDFWVGKDIAPGGYAWSFPRNDNSANVGVVISAENNSAKNANIYLENLKRKYFQNTKSSNRICGGIPAYNKKHSIISDNCLLVGDAASQVNPLTKSGILEALRAGVIAGKTILNAYNSNNFSAKFLNTYSKEWNKIIGNKHKRFNKIKKAIDSIDDTTFNKATESIKKLNTSDIRLFDIFKIILLKKPTLIKEIRHLL